MLRENDYDLSCVGRDECHSDSFSAYDVAKLQPLPLLFQTGYLTIRESRVEDEDTWYLLDYPNREVRDSFNRHLAIAYSHLDDPEASNHLAELVRALRSGDLDAFFASLRVFFAKIPHTIQLSHEKYYQSIFHILFTLIGVRVGSEIATESGRIDAVVKTKDRIYVFEFKLRGTAAEAMAQIHDKRYFEKYLADSRQITLVAAAFDKKSRNIGKWLAKPVPRFPAM